MKTELLLLVACLLWHAAAVANVVLTLSPDVVVHNETKVFLVECALQGVPFTAINEFSLYRDKEPVAILSYRHNPSYSVAPHTPTVVNRELAPRSTITGSLVKNYIGLRVIGPFPCCGLVQWRCLAAYVISGTETRQHSKTQTLQVVEKAEASRQRKSIGNKRLESGMDTLTYIDYTIIGTIAFAIIMYLIINRVDQIIFEICVTLFREPMFKSYDDDEEDADQSAVDRDVEYFRESPLCQRIQRKMAEAVDRDLESVVASECALMTEQMEEAEERMRMKESCHHDVNNRHTRRSKEYNEDHKHFFSKKIDSILKGGNRQKWEWLLKNTSGLHRCNDEELERLFIGYDVSSLDRSGFRGNKTYVTLKNKPRDGNESQESALETEECMLKDNDGFILVNGAPIPNTEDKFPLKLREMGFVWNSNFANEYEDSEFQVTEGDNFLVRFEFLDHGCILVAIKDEDLGQDGDKVLVPLDERFWVSTVLGKKFIPSIRWGFHLRDDGFFVAEYSDSDLRRTRSGHKLIPFDQGDMVRSLHNISVPSYEDSAAQEKLDASMVEAIQKFGPEMYQTQEQAEVALLSKLRKMGRISNPEEDERTVGESNAVEGLEEKNPDQTAGSSTVPKSEDDDGVAQRCCSGESLILKSEEVQDASIFNNNATEEISARNLPTRVRSSMEEPVVDRGRLLRQSSLREEKVLKHVSKGNESSALDLPNVPLPPETSKESNASKHFNVNNNRSTVLLTRTTGPCWRGRLM